MKKISPDDLSLKEKIHIAAGNSFWSMGDVKRAGLPAIKTADASNGIREQYKDEGYTCRMGNRPSICYPALCLGGCSFDTDQMFEIGRALGEECKSRGISVLLGPGINIKRSPLCGRNFEYISEDPVLSGELGAAFIKGVQSTGVAACPKHFAANNQETRRCKSDSVIDDKTLFEIYLRSFEIAVKEGKPWTIMAAYNRLNGTYCCENKWLITDVLREEWGFDGAVISDWGAVNDIEKSIEAGLDVDMPGAVNFYQKHIEDCVLSGSLDEKYLDRAADNIIRLAERTEKSRIPGFEFDINKHLEIAKKAAESSFVLLKNDGNLPLEKDMNILVVGSFAKRPRFQGAGSSKVKLSHLETPWMYLRDYFDNITYEKGFDEDPDKNDECYLKTLEAAKKADRILFFAGVPEDWESEGFDKEDMKLPDNQNRLIRAIARRNKNISVIIQAGAPVEVLWKDEVNAIMMCYLPGSCFGSALLDVITGKVSPSGRLSESFPVRLADTPNYEIYPSYEKAAVYSEGTDIGYRYYNKGIKTAYPFGHGLSYTTFKYSNLTAKLADGKIEVTCDIENTGNYDSKEVVQIYIAKKESASDRKLAAFSKVDLKKGESITAVLTIDPQYISEFDALKKAMIFEKGDYIISAGKNCEQMIENCELSVERDYVYEIKIELGNSEKAENFAYMKKEESEVTVNSSLKDLEKHKLIKPVIKILEKKGNKINGGIITPDKMPQLLLNSPFRQIAMGTNGKIKAAHIKKICAFLNKILYFTDKKKR